MVASPREPQTIRPSIALHALILESTTVPSCEIEKVVQGRYPGSVLTVIGTIDEAHRLFSSTIFDLVILAIDPLEEDHPALLDSMRGLDTSMPTVLIVSQKNEERLHEKTPRLCSTWEILPRETLTPVVLERRILKAIENHQRRWELNHLQHAFQSSLVQYRNLFDEVPDLIFLCDRSGCLLDVNASVARLFGEKKEKMLMQPIFEKFGMRREDFDRLVAGATSDLGPIQDLEIEFHPQGREPIYGLMHLIRWQHSPGRPVQFQGVVKDISPHKRLEQQLRRSEDRYKTLYDLARISSSSLRVEEVAKRSLVLIHDCCGSSGSILLLNDRYDELNLLESVGIPDEIRRRLLEERPPLIGQGLVGTLCVKGGVHRVDEPLKGVIHPVLRAWAELHPTHQMIASAMGRGNPTLPTAILLMMIPGDYAPQLDEELVAGLSKTLEMGMTNCFHYANSQEAEGRYRDLWEHAPAYFVSLLKGGVIIEINKTAVEALGYQAQDLIGKHFKRLIHPDDHVTFEERHADQTDTAMAQDYELRLRRQNGETIVVSFKSEPLHDRHGNCIGEKAVLYDITRDKALEDRLRDYAENLERMVNDRTFELTETMNFLNGILEGSTEYAILGLDPWGTFLHFNAGAQLLFGHDAASLVGQKGFDTLLNVESSPWASLPELLEAVDHRGVLVQEVPMIASDERPMIGLLTINRLKNPTANNLTYVAIVRDITEQKEMEELLKLYTENLQQVIEEKSRELDRQHIQLIQSSKLATLGEMATGIAHELNQPLSGIRTRAQLVMKALERGLMKRDRIEQNQREVIQLVDRITHIIDHMRIFARQDQQKYTPFKIVQSIQGALSLIGEQLRIHAIEVDMKTATNLPLVLGEPLQIEQVLLNLISNARDAMDSRAELERKHGRDYHKTLTIDVRPANDREICVEVADNGIGMPEEIRTKIFEPFFTTKPVGRGTGLGLSISYGILTNHSGRMEVESREEQGTRFRVYLPAWDGSQEVARVLPREDIPL